MVNPGAFQGSRNDFLVAQATIYADAIVNNQVADTVSDIQRRYFKRFPITLPHTEEPSAEWLSQVDDSAPDKDLEPPNAATMDDAAFEAAQKLYDDQLKLIKLRKGQISRRLKYLHSKAEDVPSKFKAGTDDPLFVLMSNLTGCAAQKPRRKTGYHVWAPSNRPSLDVLFEERAKNANLSGRKKVGLRTQVYKEAYDKLDEDEKAEWEAKAATEYEEALAEFEEALNAPPSTDPEDRQRVIGGLPKFAQPILDLISDYSGWKVTLIAGGPEPADNGRLNMISMHSGTTSGSTPMNFGRSERGPYKNFIVPLFANFLKKCYTIEECRASALPIEHESLADILNDDASNWEIHSMDDHVRLAGPSKHNTPSAAHFSTPRQPFRDYQDKVPASNLPTPYKVPEKATPAQIRKTVKSKAKSSTLASAPRTPTSSHVPTSRPSVRPYHVSSRGPSPAPSRGPSPPPSRCPSPAPSPAPSHGPSFVRPAAMNAASAQATVPTQKRAREIDEADTYDLRQRMRMRLSEMQADSTSNVESRRTITDASGAMDSNVERMGAASIDSDQNVRIDSTSTAGAGSNVDLNVSSSPRISSDDAPPLSPMWFKTALTLLSSEDLGDGWNRLVSSWVQFEGRSLYKENGILGNQGRPQFIADWIRHARSPKYRPKTMKLENFDQMFWTWWRSLQPDWRKDDGGGVLPRTDGDLSAIRKPGKNGILSMLAMLFFWGVAAEQQEDGEGAQAWKTAVDDVDWVIRGLLLSLDLETPPLVDI